MNPPTPTRCPNCGKLEASISCSLCKAGKIAAPQELPAKRFGDAPSRSFVDCSRAVAQYPEVAAPEFFDIFAELDRVQKILYPKG